MQRTFIVKRSKTIPKLSDSIEPKNAIENLNGKELSGRVLKVNIARPRERRTDRRPS